MRFLIAVLTVGLALFDIPTASCSAVVISANATSSSAEAASIDCVLAPSCAGAWAPGSADSGANEGVYAQFEGTVESDAIEIITNVADKNAPFTLSINGIIARGTALRPVSATGHYTMSYAVPGDRIKSIFFRLGVKTGGWRSFQLYSIRFFSHGKPIDLALPVLVPASVTASSVLEPKVAYQPANLFDSRYDFAWSVNGQTSKGKGESVELKFSHPQNLAGMIIWNGYQRSDIHFKANGRVSKLSVTDGQKSTTVAIADKMGSQRVVFAGPFQNASSLKLTIEEIVPGTKYPDVLISELRFIDDQNRILMPKVQGSTPEASPLIEPLVDRSLSSLACSSSFMPGNYQRSLRLRRDGSFVIYGKAHDEEENKKVDQVLEGNWEWRATGIRIFGKRYSDTVVRNEYSQTARRTPPSIFQSDLKVAKFGDLNPTAQQQLVALIWTRIGAKTNWNEANGEKVEIVGTRGVTLASGSSEKELLANFARKLSEQNPWTVSSPILADAFLLSDDVGACEATF